MIEPQNEELPVEAWRTAPELPVMARGPQGPAGPAGVSPVSHQQAACRALSCIPAKPWEEKTTE